MDSLLFSKIEYAIIMQLRAGPVPAVGIVKSVSAGEGCTTEAVYTALKKLRLRTVVIEISHYYSLSFPWIYKVRDFSNQLLISYSDFVPNEKLFTDFIAGKKRSIAIKCGTLQRFDFIFHQIIFALAKPQPRKTPYFFFGFAPWFFTLMEPEAKLYMEHLLPMNYIPVGLNQNLYPIDLHGQHFHKQFNGNAAKVGALLPDNFEGNYFGDICVQAQYNNSQFTAFKRAYMTMPHTNQNLEKLRSMVGEFSDIKIKVFRRENLFSKKITDQFVFKK